MERLLPGTTRETCPWCGNAGFWASVDEDAEFCPPRGHTVVWTEVEGVKVETDVCPKDPYIPLI